MLDDLNYLQYFTPNGNSTLAEVILILQKVWPFLVDQQVLDQLKPMKREDAEVLAFLMNFYFVERVCLLNWPLKLINSYCYNSRSVY